MYCSKCGVQMPENVNYCFNCGERQHDSVTTNDQKKIAELRGSALIISFTSSDLVVSQIVYNLVVSQVQAKYPKNIIKKVSGKESFSDCILHGGLTELDTQNRNFRYWKIKGSGDFWLTIFNSIRDYFLADGWSLDFIPENDNSITHYFFRK